MTNGEAGLRLPGLPAAAAGDTLALLGFVIAVSSLIRHSGFVIRHSGVIAGLALACVALLAGCSAKPVELVETRAAMNTEVAVRAIAPTEAVARRALDAAWKEMDLGAMLLDRYRKPTEAWLKGDAEARQDLKQRPSDVWRINDDAGRWSTQVDPIVTSCLSVAKEVHDLSGGAFDPTIGPLVDVWRQAAEENRLPTDDELQKARSLVGLKKVEIMAAVVVRSPKEMPFRPPGEGYQPRDLEQAVHSVGIRAGMRLDLGGVAKGYIAGRMAQRMKRAGAVAGLVGAAGDIYAFGERPAALAHEGGDRRWTVGVQDPRFPEDRSRLYTAIHVRDKGVDTSGHYYRGYTIEGNRYSHIIDPRTGRPVDTRLASVTVVADDPGLADGLATAIAVLGAKEGLAIVEKTEGVECLLLEAALKEGQTFQASGAPPPEAELVAYRSKGFKALEFKPAETKPAE
jgi:thiamine biosynthesis lipoprotein